MSSDLGYTGVEVHGKTPQVASGDLALHLLPPLTRSFSVLLIGGFLIFKLSALSLSVSHLFLLLQPFLRGKNYLLTLLISQKVLGLEAHENPVFLCLPFTYMFPLL